MLSQSMRGLYAISPHWISQKVGGGPTSPPPTEPGSSTEWKNSFFVILKPSQATSFPSLSAVVIWVPSLHAEACLEAVRGMLVVG